MESAIQRSGLGLFQSLGREQLEEMVADLIVNNSKVRTAIFNLIFSCPNIPIEW